MFIEVNNEDENFLSEHYRTTVHYSADYVGQSDAQSVSTFLLTFTFVQFMFFICEFCVP